MSRIDCLDSRAIWCRRIDQQAFPGECSIQEFGRRLDADPGDSPVSGLALQPLAAHHSLEFYAWSFSVCGRVWVENSSSGPELLIHGAWVIRHGLLKSKELQTIDVSTDNREW